MNKFLDAIRGREKISVIAEVKRRSPSHGEFPRHDVKRLVEIYETENAVALSVVTEGPRFGGSLELLREVVAHTTLPVLRKDFLTTTQELDETKSAGASAVLLIARTLTREQLQTLAEYASHLGLTPLVEIYDEDDIAKIAGLTNIVVGINNRDLATFTTNVQHAMKLIAHVDPALPLIIESAFSRPEELNLYKGKIDAVLIGTAFLTAENIPETVSSFVYEGAH